EEVINPGFQVAVISIDMLDIVFVFYHINPVGSHQFLEIKLQSPCNTLMTEVSICTENGTGF
ncbi:hypothetical protein M3P05_20330, partial [Sansalvadorimonas sp. 2012CJ34-2]